MDKHLAIVFWDLGIGGVQTRISAIVAKITKTHPSAVVTILLHKRRLNEVFVVSHPNVSIHAFSGPLIIKTPWFRKKIWRFTEIQFLIWLYHRLCHAQPTHVLTLLNRLSFSVALYVFVKKAFGSAPAFIINEPVVLSDYLTHHDQRWWQLLTMFSYRIADKIIVATDSIKNDLVTHFRANPKKIRLIRSWVPLMNTTKNNDKNKQYDGIYVGRLSAEKGIESVLDIAASPAAAAARRSFLIVGDGSLRTWLIHAIKQRQLGSRISFIGYQKNPREIMRKSRLLLLPSYNEGLPMVILEAYSVGVPVAVTPFLGAEEAVEHNKTGIIVKRSNYPTAVCELLKNETKLSKMGQAGLEKAKKDFSTKNLDLFIEAIFSP